jgi:hypothetical protein
MNFKQIVSFIDNLFSDEEDPNEAQYDPLHLGAMIIIVLFVLTLIFWLLWALLVLGGGIFLKVLPFLQLLFTSKTAADFGYEGYPYKMGVFEGWPANIGALIITVLVITAIWKIYKRKGKFEKNED